MADETPTGRLTLHELKPAEGSHRARKRIGRGAGSGTGKTAGRGQKGQKSRSGSHNMRPGFEGGQMPAYMRLGKLRGSNHRKSMPMGPFRTYTVPVNVGSLERFDAGVEVTPELLKAAGIVRKLKHPVKILGSGELTKKLTVHAHAFSKSAIAAIEAAGGTVVPLRPMAEPAPAKKRKQAAKPEPAVEPEAEAQAEAETEATEPEAEPEALAETADEPDDQDEAAAETTEE